MPQQNKIDYINNLIKPKNLVGIDRTNIPVFEIIEEKKETKAQEVCEWKRRYEEEPFQTDCGLLWNWTLEENFAFCDMNYCPKCGRKIKGIKGR